MAKKKPIPQSILESYLDAQREMKRRNAEAKEAKSKVETIKAQLAAAWKQGRRGARGKYTLEVVEGEKSSPKWKDEALALAVELDRDLDAYEKEVAERYKKEKTEVKVW